MDTAELDRAQSLERTYARRAARTRRSKWLSGVLFSLTGMALMLVLRLNPDLVDGIAALTPGTPVPNDLRTIEEPVDIHLRAMPRDVVPVRRGGALPGNGLSSN
ncbi:hypothetical protein [uncultured Tateyamaria sp.]|uniref:hypothetical protein n=1 Tax=uncultured Tateyamaria sp. TaxID=455651 RepID=UPI0026361BD9|nr:hypothetical protein [uncultured Tateyamaria sp.]